MSEQAAAPAEAETRITRVCAKCGIEDDHSHHVQYVAFNHPVTGDPTDLTVTKHVQCCAEDGCPICSTDVEHASKAQVTAEPSTAFTEYMQNKSDEHLQALFESHGIESPKFTYPDTSEEPAS
jgi:hypothetical protein